MENEKKELKPWEQPGLTVEERARALARHITGVTLAQEEVDAIAAAIAAAARDVRKAALEEAAVVADEIKIALTFGHSDADVGAGAVAKDLRFLAAKEAA